MGRKKIRKKRRQSHTPRHEMTLNQQERDYIEELKRQSREENIQLVGYRITNEPTHDKWFKRLPKKIQDRIDELHELLRKNPNEAIEEISDLLPSYPNVPILYNYLSAAYGQVGDIEKRNAIIKECYQKFPEYLFGRVSYAEMCLEQGQVEKIPEIFGEKLDLGILYPKCKTFHISEYAVFAGMAGMYYFLVGEEDAAKLYYKSLKGIAPRHLATRKLKRVLYQPLHVRFVLWLYSLLSGRKVSMRDIMLNKNPFQSPVNGTKEEKNNQEHESAL